MKPPTLHITPPRCAHPQRVLDAAKHAATNTLKGQQNISVALEPGDITRYEFTIGTKPDLFYNSATQKLQYYYEDGEMFLVLHNCGTGAFQFNIHHPYPHPLIQEMRATGQTETGDQIWSPQPAETDKLRQSLQNPNPHTALILGTFITAFNWYTTENGIIRFVESSTT